MKIHVLNKYQTSKPTVFEGYFEIDELKNYLDNQPKYYQGNMDKDDLEQDIYDFVVDLEGLENINEPANIDYYASIYDELEIINMEELTNHFSYLIKKSKLNNCCVNQTGNYCSICGTKLK